MSTSTLLKAEYEHEYEYISMCTNKSTSVRYDIVLITY